MSEATEGAEAPLASVPLEDLLGVLTAAERNEVESAHVIREIARRFQPLVRKFWRKTGGTVEYPEFLQEVFVRLFGSISGLRDAKAFPGFLRRIVIGVAADYWRRRKQEGEAYGPDVEELQQAFDADLVTSLAIRTVLERLPEHERVVIRLCVLEDQGSAEVGRLLGISAGAVRVTKSRGFKRLRELLGADPKR